MSVVMPIRLLLVYIINCQVTFGNQVHIFTLFGGIFLTVVTCSVSAFSLYTFEYYKLRKLKIEHYK